MKLIFHDRPGYAFSVQLSLELAKRGHQVLHLHDPRFQSPQGAFIKDIPAEANFELRPVRLDGPF